jgi:hypothetical protein
MPRGPISAPIRTLRLVPIWVLVCILFAGLTWTTNASAARGADRDVRPAAPRADLGQARQYHGREGPQYHQRRVQEWPLPAPSRAPNGASELKYRLLSTPFKVDFVVSDLNQRKLAISRFVSLLGAANDRLIVDRIPTGTCSPTPCIDQTDEVSAADTRNERLMLQLGGLFGVVYLVFLVVWYWATRFRPRPPRSAPT